MNVYTDHLDIGGAVLESRRYEDGFFTIAIIDQHGTVLDERDGQGEYQYAILREDILREFYEEDN